MAEAFCRRTGAQLQDKPGDFLTVRFDSRGVSLSGFGLTYQGDFVETMLHRVTRGRLQHEMLVKAVKSDKEGRKAIDATAGMGEDAFLLAAQGYEVTLYEQNPVIAALLKDAIRRAKKNMDLKDIAGRMKVIEGNSVEGMSKLLDPVDVIYLDPMFPARQKSSLINKLCSRKNLARVSATPGKTATINFYRVDTAYFVDLPGYGYAKVSNADRERWDELINSYFEADRALNVLVQLLDSRHAPSADDVQMMEYLHFHRIPFVVALTKADKLKKSEMTAQLEEFRITCAPYGCKQVFLTSAEKGTGVEELRQYLDACLAPEA